MSNQQIGGLCRSCGKTNLEHPGGRCPTPGAIGSPAAEVQFRDFIAKRLGGQKAGPLAYTEADVRAVMAGMQAEIDEMAKNAARYLVLRNRRLTHARVIDPYDHDVKYTPEGLDSYIDAILEAHSKKGPAK